MRPLSAVLLWAVALLAEAPPHEQSPIATLTGYRRDSWTSVSGAPSSIRQIVETPDG